MKHSRTPITFAAVARAAGVSTWLVYADGVRDYIEEARSFQSSYSATDEAIGKRAADASVRADLEHVLLDNRRLRTENETLKRAVRESLGRQLDDESNHHLRARIDELASTNEKVQRENQILVAECHELRDVLRNTEDDLAAARTSLRRMIRGRTDELAEPGSRSPRDIR